MFWDFTEKTLGALGHEQPVESCFILRQPRVMLKYKLTPEEGAAVTLVFLGWYEAGSEAGGARGSGKELVHVL